MKILRSINNAIVSLLKALCLGMVLVYTGVVVFQVLARNYFLISVPWTDEVALILFVWTVFLGAAVAVRQKVHFIVDLFSADRIRLNTFLDVIAGFFVLGMVLVLFYGGILFMPMGLSKTFSSIRVSQGWLYISMPVASGCMLLFTVENMVNDLRKLRRVLRGETANG